MIRQLNLKNWNIIICSSLQPAATVFKINFFGAENVLGPKVSGAESVGAENVLGPKVSGAESVWGRKCLGPKVSGAESVGAESVGAEKSGSH